MNTRASSDIALQPRSSLANIESGNTKEKEMKKGKIVGTAEAWESGALGRDADHAVAAPVETAQQIDDALGLQMISIRLPKELIEEFKMVALYHNVGYQPLMRDALKRFASAEIKKIAAQVVNDKAAKAQTRAQPAPCEPASVEAQPRAAAAQPRAAQPRAKQQEKQAA
jgi:hypothetical protein